MVDKPIDLIVQTMLVNWSNHLNVLVNVSIDYMQHPILSTHSYDLVHLVVVLSDYWTLGIFVVATNRPLLAGPSIDYFLNLNKLMNAVLAQFLVLSELHCGKGAVALKTQMMSHLQVTRKIGFAINLQKEIENPLNFSKNVISL